MAKRQRNNIVTTAFHYLVKKFPGDNPDDEAQEAGFTEQEFDSVLDLLRDVRPIDDRDPEVVSAIKAGTELHRNDFEEISPGVFFGEYEGAYYGQRIRNNLLGDIDPDSLNLRKFYYIITRTRDGKIVIGVTYHGQFGDYEGIKSYLSHHLRGNYKVASKTLKSVATEIGDGYPISLKLMYRKERQRRERRPLFGASGEIAIKRSDFGDEFDDSIAAVARRIRGTDAQRRRVISEIVRQGDLLELDEDEIVGCSAVIRENGRQRTVYFLGDNSFSTKFLMRVNIGRHGEVEPGRVSQEMLRIFRDKIIMLIHDAE